METQSIILYIMYLFQYFPEKKRPKKTRKSKKENNWIVIHRQTGNNHGYVTAHDTGAITKKVVSAKSHISLVKDFTPHDTKFILLQNNRKVIC